MIIAPSYGFVVLSLPKSASTSLDAALAPYDEVVPGKTPEKHQNLVKFHLHTVPKIERLGFARDQYEVVCLFRDPLEWLESWWRYRKRPTSEMRRAERHTGDIAFEEFVRLFLTDKGASGIKGRPARFLAGDRERGIRIDRVFAVERPDVWSSWFSGKVGASIEIRRRNRATAERPPALPDALLAELRAWFAPEYDVVDRLAATGEWTPPPGYRPPGLD